MNNIRIDSAIVEMVNHVKNDAGLELNYGDFAEVVPAESKPGETQQFYARGLDWGNPDKPSSPFPVGFARVKDTILISVEDILREPPGTYLSGDKVIVVGLEQPGTVPGVPSSRLGIKKVPPPQAPN